MSKERTELYRHYDKDGTLLYVGISLSTIARLVQHKATSHWFCEIERVTIQVFDDRESAEEAERIAIKGEQPLYNIAHAIGQIKWHKRFQDVDRMGRERVRDFEEVAKFYELTEDERLEMELCEEMEHSE